MSLVNQTFCKNYVICRLPDKTTGFAVELKATLSAIGLFPKFYDLVT